MRFANRLHSFSSKGKSKSSFGHGTQPLITKSSIVLYQNWKEFPENRVSFTWSECSVFNQDQLISLSWNEVWLKTPRYNSQTRHKNWYWKSWRSEAFSPGLYRRPRILSFIRLKLNFLSDFFGVHGCTAFDSCSFAPSFSEGIKVTHGFKYESAYIGEF